MITKLIHHTEADLVTQQHDGEFNYPKKKTCQLLIYTPSQ